MEKIENFLLSENDIALAIDLYKLTVAAAHFAKIKKSSGITGSL